MLLVPNAALRFTPPTEKPSPAAAAAGGRCCPVHPGVWRQEKIRERQGRRRAARQIWLLRDGQPVAMSVTIGSSDGRMTEVTGEGLAPGLPRHYRQFGQQRRERHAPRHNPSPTGRGELTADRTARVTKVYGRAPRHCRPCAAWTCASTQGEFVAVMGPSGSGKSTAMNILGCLDTPTTGAYRFRGVDVERCRRNQRALLRRHYLGFVFQGFNLLARTTALENVELPLIYRGEPAQRAPRARRARRSARSGLTGWETPHARPNSPAASSSGSPSPGPSSPARPCCWPTSRPAISTPQRSHEIMELLAALNRDRGITIADGDPRTRHGRLCRAHRALRRRPGGSRPTATAEVRLMLWNTLLLALRAIRRNLHALLPDHPGHRHRRAAVITMVTLGNGATASVSDQIASLGSNLLMVRPGQRHGPGPVGGRRASRSADAEAISAQISRSWRHRRRRSRLSATVVLRRARTGPPSSPAAPTPISPCGNWKLAGGPRRSPTPSERAGRAVCVIGETVRRELFGARTRSAARSASSSSACEVIGLLAPRASRPWARIRTTSSSCRCARCSGG